MAGDHLGQVLALEELHRDVEVRTVGAVLVHLGHLAIDLPQLLLVLGSFAFRLDDLARLLIVADRNQLQCDAARGPRVVGDEDVCHASTTSRSKDCVRPDLKARRRDHGCAPRRPRDRVGAAARGTCGSRNQFSRVRAVRAGSLNE